MRLLLLGFAWFFSTHTTVVMVEEPSSKQPNILWVITDDHRADSIRAFIQATAGRDNSGLDYPSVDEGPAIVLEYCNNVKVAQNSVAGFDRLLTVSVSEDSTNIQSPDQLGSN